MVKLKGPGMAVDAAGGLGEVMIFSQSKGRAYAKQWKAPKNPNTNPQRAMRAIMSFLSSDWRNLATPVQEFWIPYGESDRITALNAFLGENVRQWRNGLAPSWSLPAIRMGPQATAHNIKATGGSRSITFSGDIIARHAGWPMLFYCVPTAAAPKRWDYLVGAIAIPLSGPFEWVWRPIPAGTYYLAIGRSTNTGQLWSAQVDRTAVVT